MGQPQAGAISKIFDVVTFVVDFLPEWLWTPFLCLVAVLALGGWIIFIRRKRARRQTAGNTPPVAAPTAPRSGADFLGPYAPRRRGDGGAG
ncbi:hypothetical protein [Streptomyces sp. NPDC004726]